LAKLSELAEFLIVIECMRRAALTADSLRGRTELLILQPTAFCNIDCSYCYLPDRSDPGRMSTATLEAACRRLFDAELAAPRLSIVWHAGEPLTVPIDFYERAFAVIDKARPSQISVQHHFQTNGMLLNDKWSRFLKDAGVRVGISIDGPDSLHDRYRKTRSGKGTFRSTMSGVSKLREHGVDFHVICVLTRESLHHPDAIFDFFADLKPNMLCFNVEEIEGANTTSSLTSEDSESLTLSFMHRIISRLRESPGALRIREFDGVLNTLRSPSFGEEDWNSLNEPFKILSIARDGSWCTWSPELLGTMHGTYGQFGFGNVNHDDIVESLQSSPRFSAIVEDIDVGVSACRQTCDYFAFCKGGAPANKLHETGSFRTTETMYCRLTQKAIVEAVLTALEQDLVGARPIQWTLPDLMQTY
jgi:uncharacterized protein